jgi:hypothetical protein
LGDFRLAELELLLLERLQILFELRGVFRGERLVNNDFEFHDSQPPIITQRLLQMRNDDVACQERMVVCYVCLRVSRSVLKLNFKPIPTISGADPDVRRAYRRLNCLGFFHAQRHFPKSCPISDTQFLARSFHFVFRDIFGKFHISTLLGIAFAIIEIRELDIPPPRLVGHRQRRFGY